MLLDCQSTVSVFCNRKYLKNIRKSGKTLTVHSNGGTQVSSFVGDTSFGTVWYNPQSLTNILSMARVRKQCHLTRMDTSVEIVMYVHCNNRSAVMKLTEFASGLYYYDAMEKNAVVKISRAVSNRPSTSSRHSIATRVKVKSGKLVKKDKSLHQFQNINIGTVTANNIRFHLNIFFTIEDGIGYDAIIGRDLLLTMGINLNFKEEVIEWDRMVSPMKDYYNDIPNAKPTREELRVLMTPSEEPMGVISIAIP